MEDDAEAQRAAKNRKENLVLGFLAEKRGGKFLEIGIGAGPKLARLKEMLAKGISYTGVDFAAVAEDHLQRLQAAGLGAELADGRIRFITNSKGSYNYNLLKLVRAGERFDLIYLDGHHTLDVDVQAAVWAARMLKRGGLMAVDDINWTLMKIARMMHERLQSWLIYGQVYDLSRYTTEEMAERNMQTIVNEVLIPVFGFERVENLSQPGWAVLRRK